MIQPLIQLIDVALAFGEKRVLDGLNLEIMPNTTTVIVGRSGSGKTVLLKLMMGLLTPQRGRVLVFGRDLATLSAPELVEIRKRMSMLFQNYALMDALSVEDNVEFPLREGRGATKRDAERLARELVRLLGLGDSEHLLPEALSGGMRKRVGLARALVAKPEVVLFDEPTTGLDPIMVERVDAMIALAKREYGITPVIISHDLASVKRLADRVAFLHDGTILVEGSYDEVSRSELPPIREFFAKPATAHATTARDRGAAIELAGVHKWFGDKHVLRGIDLAIPRGQITALIGASGSGKSVIARHVMGLLKPDRGVVRVFGDDVARMREEELATMRRRFGLVFQHGALLDWLTVAENIAFPLEQRGVSRHESRVRVEEVLARLEIAEVRRRLPGEISAGERKRVALARALVVRPEVLIYDEPTTGQDPVRTHEIDRMIRQAHDERGLTSLVISHDMDSTFRIADRVALLHEGRIAVAGTPAEVAASSDPRVREFLRASAA